MDRREALRRTAMLMGGVVSAPVIAGILKGCTATPVVDWTPVILNGHQASVVTTVAEIIIPRTDTPGAKDVGVPAFIDKMISEVYSEEDQKSFMDGLAAFEKDAEKEYSDAFSELDEEEQTVFVKKVHDAAIEAENGGGSAAKRPFILMMKEMTMVGFFTSEAGASQVLQYDAVPGAYKGCVPLSEAGNGKAWAT